jgi:hypothetical protein
MGHTRFVTFWVIFSFLDKIRSGRFFGPSRQRVVRLNSCLVMKIPLDEGVVCKFLRFQRLWDQKRFIERRWTSRFGIESFRSWEFKRTSLIGSLNFLTGSGISSNFYFVQDLTNNWGIDFKLIFSRTKEFLSRLFEGIRFEHLFQGERH